MKRRFYPFLTITVNKVVIFDVVPLSPQTNNIWWAETTFTKNDEIREETSSCLDHSNHTISQTDQPLVHKLVPDWISWLPLHNVSLSSFISKGDGRNQISTQINAENGDCSEGQWDTQNHEHQEGRNLRDVTCQCVGNWLLQVVENQST